MDNMMDGEKEIICEKAKLLHIHYLFQCLFFIFNFQFLFLFFNWNCSCYAQVAVSYTRFCNYIMAREKGTETMTIPSKTPLEYVNTTVKITLNHIKN